MKIKLLFILGSFLLVTGCNWTQRYSVPSVSISTSSAINIIDHFSDTEQKNWKTYRENTGFEFRYHPDMVTMLTPEPGPLNYTVALSFPSSWYVGTNLQSASLGVSVSSSCPNLYASEEKYVGSLSKTIKSSDNIEFTLHQGDEAAAGNYYKTLLYSAVKNNTCYSVFVNLHSTNRMNYDEANRPTEYDPKKFEEVLVKVVSTFKILK